MTGSPSTILRTAFWVLIVAAVGLTIFHIVTDAGDDQEAAGWITWTAAVLAFAAAAVGFLDQFSSPASPVACGRVKTWDDAGVVRCRRRLLGAREPVIQFDVGASPGSRACRLERAS